MRESLASPGSQLRHSALYFRNVMLNGVGGSLSATMLTVTFSAHPRCHVIRRLTATSIGCLSSPFLSQESVVWIFIHVALPTSCVHQAFDFDLRRCKVFWIMFWSRQQQASFLQRQVFVLLTSFSQTLQRR